MSGSIDSATAALGKSSIDKLGGRALADAELAIAPAVAANVKRQAARHRRTGRMVSQITYTVSGHGTGQQVRVEAGGKIAALIAGGTRAHRIVSHGRAMPLSQHGGATRSFAASVHHPGTVPDPFFAEGVAASAGAIQAALDDAAGELVTTLARAVEG